MAKKNKIARPEARLPKGFRDIGASELAATRAMLDTIRGVYETYGFEELETPAIEYTEALGKFLPDQDRPNEGVFSFTDDDDQWLSLRYDLTAPLARYVAENYQTLPKPFRRYATGTVYRNEKPGPGRFRQFTQFDADTVGTANLAADAEICMLAADTLKALGLEGKYRIKVNNRKVLDGMLQSVGVDIASDAQRLGVLRSLDKLDKFSREDVALLLGSGRKDESGAFTPGVGLNPPQIEALLDFVSQPPPNSADGGITAKRIGDYEPTDLYVEGLGELLEIARIVESAGYGPDRIGIDYSVVRGLEYYTGPVFEADLTFEVKDDKGNPVRFGSVGGGGRYDGLVERFLGQKVPATGFSIGVSRLQAALNLLNAAQGTTSAPLGPVVVLVMDKGELPRYQKFVQMLRNADPPIRAEMYLGTSGMKAQMKYADKRGAPCVIIQGSDERERGEVQLKDLIEGAKAAQAIADNKEWKEARPAQVSVKEADLVSAVREIVARHGGA